MKVILLSLFLLGSVSSQSCEDFQEGSCPLEEDNIVGTTSDVETPGDCQALCKYTYANNECQFFTFFGTECYQLATCDTVEYCEGCVSGPIDPHFTDCVVNTGSLCHQEGNLIEHIEHIHDASDCQAICQNHASCNFWSHYLEEGGEHWGHCLLHYTCDQQDVAECGGPGDHECPVIDTELYDKFFRYLPINGGYEPRPGGRKCYCMNGANEPDLDECGAGPLPCLDDFFPGTLCDEENLAHIEGISLASDCQAVCQNHVGCEYFSHYTEEGGEHWGHCFLHAQCNGFNNHECNSGGHCGWGPQSILDIFTHHRVYEDPEPFPGERCNCIAGPVYPDIDDCSSPEF